MRAGFSWTREWPLMLKKNNPNTCARFDNVRNRLDILSEKDSLSNNELLEIYRLIATLESIEGSESEKQQERAATLLDCESIRRTEAIRKRHEFLLDKALSGTPLTKEEKNELDTTAEALSWKH